MRSIPAALRPGNHGTRPRRRQPSWLYGAVLLLLASGWVCGCTGSADIRVLSLNYVSIDPPSTDIARVHVNHCFWWADDDGRLWIAMHGRRDQFFSDLTDLDFKLSLRLEQPPAGQARNYLAGRDELRARVQLGPVQSRFESSRGVVAVYRAGADGYRGRFRLRVTRETSNFLGGWSRPSAYLLLGEFTAAHDPERGRALAEATEAGGWERENRPANVIELEPRE